MSQREATTLAVELAFAGDMLERIRAAGGRFHERAYLFMLGAIEYLQTRLPERRHVTGQELAWACRDLAIEQYGLMAHTVLTYWGISSTRDLGEIVFTLVDVRLLAAQPEDRPDDFHEVFDFANAFSALYVWRGIAERRNEASIPPEEQ